MKHTIKYRVERKVPLDGYTLMYRSELSCHGGIGLLNILVKNVKDSIKDEFEIVFGDITKEELVDKSWITHE